MSATPATDQPPGFDTATPPRPPWWRRKLRRLGWPHWAAIGLLLATATGCLIAGADKYALVAATSAVGNLLIWLFRSDGPPLD
jgi:hypothetical protein